MGKPRGSKMWLQAAPGIGQELGPPVGKGHKGTWASWARWAHKGVTYPSPMPSLRDWRNAVAESSIALRSVAELDSDDRLTISFLLFFFLLPST